MCRPRPGPRCSDYAVGTYNVTRARLARNIEALQQYEEKYADSLNNTENPNGRDLIRQNRHEKLKAAVEQQQQAVHEAEFEYHATPAGQRDLDAQIRAAETNGEEALVAELQERKAAGEDYRKQQREQLKQLQDIEENEGPEAAEKKAWEMYEQAAADEVEANLGMYQSQQASEEATAAQEEYNRVYGEFLEQHGGDPSQLTPEQLAQLKKMKTQIILGVMAAAAVLSFSLIKSAATGQKSSLLHYGKSMAMRRIMSSGQHIIGNLGNSSATALQERNRQAAEEAHRRATAAAEKVLAEAEQQRMTAERRAQVEQEREADRAARQQAREEQRAYESEMRAQQTAERQELIRQEREAEKAYRQQAMEEQRAYERQRREEELEHYRKLSEIPLPPEVEAELRQRVPKPTRSRRTAQPTAV